MKRKFAKRLFSGSILFLLLTQAGCYSQTPYPYGSGYGENGQYYGGYPTQGYGSNYPSGYRQQGYPGYSGQGYYGQGYQGNEDEDGDDDDYRERRFDRHRSWQGNPSYGGY